MTDLKDKYYPVLNCGFVALKDCMGDDKAIEEMARVSYQAGTRAKNDTEGLLRYLMRHRHTSPFERVEFVFHVGLPIFVARQWIRHRTACLTGDNELHFDLPGGIERRGNQLHKLRIKDVFNGFQHHKRDRIKNMMLRCVNEHSKEICHTNIVDIWESGIKQIYKVTFADGKYIRASEDHLFLTENGWRKLKDLSHTSIVIDRRDRSTYLVAQSESIVSIDPDGEEMTYDIEVDGPHHNFSCNGIIVHNSVNEYSGRYSVMPMLFYDPLYDRCTTQNKSNKQGSSQECVSVDQFMDMCDRRDQIRYSVETDYDECLLIDLARELARTELPLSTYTYWYWKIDLHNLFHFLSLRLDKHAQWEIRQYANVIARIVENIVPLSWEAFKDYRLHGISLGLQERLLLDSCFTAQLIPSLPEHEEPIRLMATDKGMSAREATEFLSKFAAPEVDSIPRLPQPKTPEYFQKIIEDAS